MFDKNKVKWWFIHNQPKIVWFIIGWLTTSGIRDLLMGNYIGAAMSFLFAYLNYIMNS